MSEGKADFWQKENRVIRNTFKGEWEKKENLRPKKRTNRKNKTKYWRIQLSETVKEILEGMASAVS